MLSNLERLAMTGKVSLEYTRLTPDTERVFMLTWRKNDSDLVYSQREVYTTELAEAAAGFSIAEVTAGKFLVRAAEEGLANDHG